MLDYADRIGWVASDDLIRAATERTAGRIDHFERYAANPTHAEAVGKELGWKWNARTVIKHERAILATIKSKRRLQLVAA